MSAAGLIMYSQPHIQFSPVMVEFTLRPGTCSIRIENSPGTSVRSVIASESESPVGCKALRSDLILLTAALSCPYYE
jgi:hypothetical protein